MPTPDSAAETASEAHTGADNVHTLPGRSLVPAFGGRPITREQIFWEHEANRALRMGPWKLVAKGPDRAWELYDMRTDRTETCDLSASMPERVREMAERWDSIARVTDVYPLFGDVPGLHYGERANMSSWAKAE